MSFVEPNITPAPKDEGLPFGIPIVKTYQLGDVATSSNVAGDITKDAFRWKGIQLYQNLLPAPVHQYVITGIQLEWYTRLGTPYVSSIISVDDTHNIPPSGGLIDIPFGATNVVITPLYVTDPSYPDPPIWIGLQVTYKAANGDIFTQTAKISSMFKEGPSFPPYPIMDNEVITGITIVTPGISIGGNGIYGIQLQIAPLPFAVQYTDITGPSEPVKATVAETDELAIEIVDNSAGLNDLLASINLSYNYQTSHQVVDTLTRGISQTAGITAKQEVSAGVFFSDVTVSFSLSLAFNFNTSKGKSIGTLYTNQKTYSTFVSIIVPAGKKTKVSLTAYELTGSENISFTASANAIYSWYQYTDGGIYTSTPILTDLEFSNIQTTQHFNISQDKLDS